MTAGRPLRADLHVHTALSPCAAREMTPLRIAAVAELRELDLIAVCDHNSAGNVGAVARAAEGALAVLPGVEIATSEEVHLLGLFADEASAHAVADHLADTLPALPDGPPVAGLHAQELYTSRDRLRGLETRMLSMASGFTLDEAVELVRRYGGLAIAAHVDRPTFGLFAQLGLLPAGLSLDALELSAAGARAGGAVALAAHGLPIVTASDAHCLDELGASVVLLDVEAPTLAELRLALSGAEGRRCRLA